MNSPQQRFFALVDTSSDCWIWIGHRNHAGYGQFWMPGGPVRAHRWSYAVFIGAIPSDHEVDHLCRNRACVNPEHLEAVSHAENSRRAAYTTNQCHRGHQLPEAATGRRVCRQCANHRNRRYKARIRAMRLYDAITGGAS